MSAPTKPSTGTTLEGLAAQLAGNPMADTPRGGAENGFRGVTMSDPTNGGFDANGVNTQASQFAGMGPALDAADSDVFKQMDGLVLRQDMLARNHLAQDSYYTCLAGGYPWGTLTHDTTRDLYTFTLPYGATSTTIQAVPNKNLDLINKAAATVLADFPQANAEPIDDTEEAEAAADMANRFLAENAGEQGTNDEVLFDDRVKRALVSASTYVEGWVDPTGGGYVPLQIKAHPQAVSPVNPLVGPDGMPTTDYVLRYVTPDHQFTEDATKAAPQWQPKILGSSWGREHLRVFPEDKPVWQADKVIVLGYCTIAEGKRRWPSVAAMTPAELSSLTDWTPQRYLVLLPPFQRARWKLTDGREKEKAGASDERIFFYYHLYAKASPEYPQGADVVVSGMKGGTILDKQILATPVTVTKGATTATELRCREIPIVQVTPRGDPNGRDPSGLAFLEMFVGATENSAGLAMGFSENIDKINHNPFAVPSTSPIEGWQVEDARASGDMLLVTSKDDMPKQLDPPQLPSAFFEMYDRADEAINSIAAQERAAQGNEYSKERSGKALQIAISRNNVANTAMQTAVNNAIARWNRIKLELAMAHYTTPQLIKYQGEDGAYKESEFTGVDFALVGKVSIKAGTGTMMPPDQKVNYLGNLRANGMIDDEEAKEAARPAFAKELGLQANPHEQYVERCIDAWLQGPPADAHPDPTPDPMTGQPRPKWSQWQQQYAAWTQAQDAYQQALAQFTQQQQAQQQYLTNKAIVAGGAPSGMLGPEGQEEKASTDYQQAVIAMQMAEMQNPAIGQILTPPPPPQVPKPWTPFTPRPNDNEPVIAAIWARKLSRTMSTVKYEQFIPEWRDVLDRQYTLTRQAVAVASAAQSGHPAPGRPAPPIGQQPQPPQRPQQAHAQAPRTAA